MSESSRAQPPAETHELDDRPLDRSERSREPAADGRPTDVSITVSPLKDVDGQLGVSTIARAITTPTRAEADIRRLEQRVRTLSAQLQAVREDERTRIAREIHDELGQVLTGLKIEISLLKQSLPDHRPEDSRDALARSLQRMAQLVDGSIGTVRKIAGELRPVILDSLGLAAAIESHTEDFLRSSAIGFELSLPAEECVLNRDTSTALFRILQEALTNVVRHAHAHSVRVRLWNEGETAVLQVEDDGIGFRPELASSVDSLGLFSMTERALMLGGTLDVTSVPGAGTSVTARVPSRAERITDR